MLGEGGRAGGRGARVTAPLVGGGKLRLYDVITLSNSYVGSQYGCSHIQVSVWNNV